MTEVAQQVVIEAGIDAAWRVAGDFGMAAGRPPSVLACTVEGEVPGALHVLTHADGTTTVERLEAIDPHAHCLTYALLSDTPFDHCLTTLALRALTPARTALTWTVRFQPDGIPEREAVELLAGFVAANCRAVKRLVEEGDYNFL